MEIRKRLERLEERTIFLKVNSEASVKPLQNAHDVVDLLAEQINAVRADVTIDPTERARLIGGLCGIALKAIEQAEGDARLEAVERVLRLRIPER